MRIAETYTGNADDRQAHPHHVPCAPSGAEVTTGAGWDSATGCEACGSLLFGPAPGDLVKCRPVHGRPFLATVLRVDPDGTHHVATRWTLAGSPHPFRGQARAFPADRVLEPTAAERRKIPTR